MRTINTSGFEREVYGWQLVPEWRTIENHKAKVFREHRDPRVDREVTNDAVVVLRFVQFADGRVAGCAQRREIEILRKRIVSLIFEHLIRVSQNVVSGECRIEELF